jgi:hypothetical protein
MPGPDDHGQRLQDGDKRLEDDCDGSDYCVEHERIVDLGARDSGHDQNQVGRTSEEEVCDLGFPVRQVSGVM